MALDPNIALQLKPVQLDNPLTQFAQFAQVQGLQNQNQLAQYTLAKAKREDEDTIAQRNLLTGAGGDLEAGYNALLKGGYLDKAMAIRKAQQEQLKTGSEITKNNAEAASKTQDVAAKRLETIGQTMASLQGVPGVTPQHVVNGLQHLVDIGAIPADQLPRLTSEIPKDPTALTGWLDMKGKSALKVADQMKYTAPDANTVANNRTSIAVGAGHDQASLTNAAATREVAKATRDAAGVQRDQATEMKLADDYRAQSKTFKETGDAYRQLNATLGQATTSPAATLAAATKFMKLLDPGSVVRESELGMALAATGVFDRASNYFNVLQSGKVLTPSQVEDFKNITKQIYGAAQAGQQSIDASYRQQAEGYKLRPEMIIQDLGQNQKPATPQQRVKEAVNNGTSGRLADLRPVQVSTAEDYAKLAPGTVFATPDGKHRVKQ